MRLVHSVAELRQALAGEDRTALVPTMGNLHAGHIALVERAQTAGCPVVASIFVNPLQFGPGEDLQHYPRTLAADCAQLENAGCDIVFAPDVTEVYPEPQTFQVQPPLADELCGAFRPGHFAGVCTVVLKLFEMVRPRYAVFGKKDYQQLFLLKAMTRQFNLDIELLECETLRAEDDLALSSRNGYLSSAERAEAPRLYAELKRVADALRSGTSNFAELEAASTDRLKQHGWQVDYLSVRSRNTLLPPTAADQEWVVLAAARLGATRLIDNIETGRATAQKPWP
ncbi:MAG: pantoate--beta-alanine ligase [Hydrogenophilales bacterium CG03_land_8_20_14_0_80_62_28]|nr:pantoate--beta-alanine ligase [Betaproteobacteria bacterium]OIO79321.1 MAG: pantoate--beta-alanine ligase [Hydrogenophilaceae bacterium CG1_02_62_390]PIV24241.1 MAG: pantoate--beta-alanine ligase [Hydrogenophilales bacterium CG03_land_8_20_14_0_80_62_28]PIW39041.1 MAG: pantoate--beta-alanine ligase [Hydrogenophilales bacterium CG15_BIG_FIL_POST_REV_8_21_14_020_62_31]PIW71448.1 MAG: pantoate--beta-alanine ligase [Hydrogenophilales bacterium CG12_big_fil_rev_8_21_14_0_65_61_21]PIX01819.1 MAG: